MCIHTENMQITDARFLPIVRAYAEKISLVERIDAFLDSEMDVSPGRIVLAMILDALSGRNPLFRVQEFFADKDIELLLGEAIPLSKLSDDTLGRVLEKVWDVGTNKVLGTVMLGVMQIYDPDTSHVHHDTTSCELFGDYLLYESEDHDQPFVITNGFSKGHRPDLKQLVLSLLCVDHAIPIGMLTVDGNASDKTINHRLIPEMAKRMRSLGQQNFIYVADSALITHENLALIDDWDKGFLFVSRLPRTYNECHCAIEQAIDADAWEEIGVISNERETRNCTPASYRCFETTVTLYGNMYRALVVHSDAYDERRQKQVENQIATEQEDLTKLKKQLEKIDYACLPDAEAAARRIQPGRFHEITISVHPKPQYHQGRPRADGTRKLKSMRYPLEMSIAPHPAAVDRLRQEALLCAHHQYLV